MSNTLIGLGDVLNDLINLHNSNRLPNKLLLSGTQGIGKGVLSKHLLNHYLYNFQAFLEIYFHHCQRKPLLKDNI